MIHISPSGAFWQAGQWLDESVAQTSQVQPPELARKKTIAYRILASHSKTNDGGPLRITFDALASHDITYVGIIQTARASGLRKFPLPFVLTNCHNSLCAVGGTVNEDDHMFGLSACKRYGGIYVPTNMAVIHQYVREMMAGCGKMILGSDSHTRYGALGCMGIGEGGPELVKQLLKHTYDLDTPEVVAVHLEGKPRPGVGPQDVSLALIKAVFKKGLVTNKVLEFIGPGVANLSVDFRMGIDVMTTETTCLSSIWQTDDLVLDWLAAHNRAHDYQRLEPGNGAWYDGVIHIDLDKIEPMIALPFHPSNAWTIREFLANAEDLLAGVEKEAAGFTDKVSARPKLLAKLQDGALMVDQGVVAGCSGGVYENIMRMVGIMEGKSSGCGAFSLSVYPASQPQYLELVRNGAVATLMETGAVLKPAFCGPCFGAGDIPANNCLSIRHTTRNFPHREGSKPVGGQVAYVALMDARSIAATAINGGKLTGADEIPGMPEETPMPYHFDGSVYNKRVYNGFGKPDQHQPLIFGPNIADWPAMLPLPENLILFVASAIYDEVTTTDELIPSGETASFRSSPLKLAEFALSRKDPKYVNRAKAALALEKARRAMAGQTVGQIKSNDFEMNMATISDVKNLFEDLGLAGQEASTGIGSAIVAMRPGDGSAREQAASVQKVLGGWADIAVEYATKRYRASLVNWGMLPFTLDEITKSKIQPGAAFVLPDNRRYVPGDIIHLPGIRKSVEAGDEHLTAYLIQGKKRTKITLNLPNMNEDERAIILAGCLINYYNQNKDQEDDDR